MRESSELEGRPLAQKPNFKSDVEAKEAFIRELLARGFESARVTRSPADITATRDDETYYYEIKYTTRTDSYFGAATLTEWEAAVRFEARYWFVVASKRGGKWLFHKYTPAEFMEFNTIPPFKTYFAVAEQLVQSGPLPKKAEVDALHIGIAAVHGMEYVLTWNCKHIANARMRSQIEAICRDLGYEPPIMCTPEELMEE